VPITANSHCPLAGHGLGVGRLPLTEKLYGPVGLFALKVPEMVKVKSVKSAVLVVPSKVALTMFQVLESFPN
jgi:hypothetical protein